MTRSMLARNALLVFWGVGSAYVGWAQNLVPNASFEEYATCPDDIGEIGRVRSWFASYQTPDYFNVCASPGPVGIPANILRYQQPASGNAYAGVLCYSMADPGFELHEILGVRLEQPLQIGRTYWASLKISWTAGYLSDFTSIRYATNNIGVLLMNDSVVYDSGNWMELPNRAQVFTSDIVSDSSSWIEISGEFVADSTYRYLYVGNFFYDSVTQYIVMQPQADMQAYYYVDDVCLSSVPDFCPMAASVNENGAGDMPLVRWSEVSAGIEVIGLKPGVYNVVIYDTSGRITYRSTVQSDDTGRQIVLRTPHGLNGLFIFCLEGGGQEWNVKLLLPSN